MGKKRKCDGPKCDFDDLKDLWVAEVTTTKYRNATITIPPRTIPQRVGGSIVRVTQFLGEHESEQKAREAASLYYEEYMMRKILKIKAWGMPPTETRDWILKG